MRYACLVYFDPQVVFNQSAESDAVLRDGFTYLEQLRDSGVLVTDGALQLPDQTMTVRVDDAGELVLLEAQDRARWDRALIDEGRTLVDRALRKRSVGPYLLQAAIVAVHVEAASYADTDWTRIVALYDVLKRVAPSPVVALNRAVALGMRDGPRVGLDAIDAILREGVLTEYHLAHAARADLQRRLGLTDAARASYERALELAQQPAERRFLQARLAQLRQ